MPEYRIYQLDNDGRPSGAPSVGVWGDDNQAEANARILHGSRPHEIWCGERKVAAIKPD